MTKPVERPRSATQEPYLRIGELSARAGVSIATIKYYIREGLLPAAPLKTGRTMGYYDHAYLERLRLIRTLREAHFLPLRVIKAILAERAGEPLGAGEAEALARVAPSVMRTLAGGGEASREDLRRRYGLSDDELSVLEDMDLVGEPTPTGRRYRAADMELLDAIHKLDQAGMGRARFPIEGLGHYVELLGELARREVRRFIRRGAPGTTPLELDHMAHRALALSEPLVLAIRRRLIARALQAELNQES